MIIIKKKHYEIISKVIKDYAGILLERIPQKRVEKKLIEQMEELNYYNLDNYIDLL